MNKWIKIIGLVVLILLLGYVFFLFSLSNKVLEPGSSHELSKERFITYWNKPIDHFLDMVPEPQTHKIKGYENIDINLKYITRSDDPSCALILSHGWSQDWSGMLKFVPALSDCDCDYVLYDMRAHGESGGEYPTGGIKEGQDLLKITDWVSRYKQFEYKDIGWVGSSWGAGASIMAGADKKDVGFILVDAPFSNWNVAIFERAALEYGEWILKIGNQVMKLVGWRAGVNTKDASALANIPELDEPIMIIHSQTDSETNSQQSVELAKHLNHEKSVFHHLDWGEDHSRDVYINRDRYKILVNDFLNSIDSSYVRKS